MKKKERIPCRKPLPTIWRVPDELWEKIEPILAEHDPPKRTGRPRVDQRAVFDQELHKVMLSNVSCNNVLYFVAGAVAEATIAQGWALRN
jgi:hypothetical protein